MLRLAAVAVVALTLFACGFAGRLVLEANADTGISYPSVIAFQMCWYGAGLLVLLAWWLRSADAGPRGLIGCVGLLAVAALCGVAILTSVPK